MRTKKKGSSEDKLRREAGFRALLPVNQEKITEKRPSLGDFLLIPHHLKLASSFGLHKFTTSKLTGLEMILFSLEIDNYAFLLALSFKSP